MNTAFHVHSPIEAEVLKPLVKCQLDALFAREAVISPMGLNLFFPAEHYSDYAQLINREISLYSGRFQHRRVTKIWFRGMPLTALKAGELTELAFHTNMLFCPEAGGMIEYGFECEPGEITPSNLALMKGLRFNHILLSISAAIPPEKQHISQLLAQLDEYHFQEVRYRLDVADTDPDTLRCWVTALLQHKPGMVEVQQLAKMDEPVPLSTLARQFAEHHYLLLGERFFVPRKHQLASLREQKNVQYTPWGLCQRQLADWVGVGLGALGKLGNGYYQNAEQMERYRTLIELDQLPVCCSGSYPNCRQKPHPWYLVEQLLCHHRVFFDPSRLPVKLAPAIITVFKEAEESGWLRRAQEHLILTDGGLNHLPALCQKIQSS